MAVKRNRKGVTVSEEKFCQAYIKTGNASEAYKMAYNVGKKTKATTIYKEATTVMKRDRVKKRIEELKEKFREEQGIDQEYILKEYKLLLDSCKAEGLDGKGTIKDRTNWARALAQLTKMLGLDAPDKTEVEHKGIEGINITIKKNTEE